MLRQRSGSLDALAETFTPGQRVRYQCAGWDTDRRGVVLGFVFTIPDVDGGPDRAALLVSRWPAVANIDHVLPDEVIT